MTVEESKVKSGRPALHSTVMWKTQILLNTEKKKKMLNLCPCPPASHNVLRCSLCIITFNLEEILEMRKSTSFFLK